MAEEVDGGDLRIGDFPPRKTDGFAAQKRAPLGCRSEHSRLRAADLVGCAAALNDADAKWLHERTLTGYAWNNSAAM